MTTVFNLLLAGLVFAWIVVMYLMLGLPRLWGPERGVPFCGHPFELTWPHPEWGSWRCPKCHTLFIKIDEKWVAERVANRR
jgi:hypothetical protein